MPRDVFDPHQFGCLHPDSGADGGGDSAPPPRPPARQESCEDLLYRGLLTWLDDLLLMEQAYGEAGGRTKQKVVLIGFHSLAGALNMRWR
jgi:hypothetical protein